MSMYRFRLSDSRGQTVEFNTTLDYLKNRVNRAYVSYCACHASSELLLEVHHGGHGWQPVYDSFGYCKTILNPLTFNYQALKQDVLNTLSIVDNWPSRKQLLQAESGKHRLERDRAAIERRAAFRVYSNPAHGEAQQIEITRTSAVH